METKFCKGCERYTVKLAKGSCVPDDRIAKTIQLSGDRCFAESDDIISLHFDVMASGIIACSIIIGKPKHVLGLPRYRLVESIGMYKDEELVRQSPRTYEHVPVVLYAIGDKR